MNMDWLTPEVMGHLSELQPMELRVADDDITYCHGEDCPQKESCLRWFKNYKGKSPYLSMVQTLREDGKCGHYQSTIPVVRG